MNGIVAVGDWFMMFVMTYNASMPDSNPGLWSGLIEHECIGVTHLSELS